MHVMKDDSITGCKSWITEWVIGKKKFLIEKLDSEILKVLIMPTSWWFMYI